MTPQTKFQTFNELYDYISCQCELVGMTYTLSGTLIHPELTLHIMNGHLWSMTYVKVNAEWHLQRYSVDASGIESDEKDKEFIRRAMMELRRIEGEK